MFLREGGGRGKSPLKTLEKIGRFDSPVMWQTTGKLGPRSLLKEAYARYSFGHYAPLREPGAPVEIDRYDGRFEV